MPMLHCLVHACRESLAKFLTVVKDKISSFPNGNLSLPGYTFIDSRVLSSPVSCPRMSEPEAQENIFNTIISLFNLSRSTTEEAS